MIYMRTVAAVLSKEIVERRLLFVAAILLGLLSLATGLFAESLREDPHDLMAVCAGAIAIAFGTAVSIGIGASMFNSDLYSERLPFYFSRPLPSLAFWAGRWTGSLLLTCGATLLVFVPPLLLDVRFDRVFAELGVSHLITKTLLGTAVLTVGSHVVTTLLRDRSAWLLVDLTAIVGAWLATTTCHSALVVLWQGYSVRSWSAYLPIVAALVALVSLAQVVVGRADRGRNRQAASVALIVALAIPTTLSVQWTRRQLSPSAERIHLATPTGWLGDDWLRLEVALTSDPFATKAEPRRTLLLNTNDGRARFLGTALLQSVPLAASDSGSHVAWVSQESDRTLLTVEALDDAETREISRWTLGSTPGSLELSRDGAWVAVGNSEQVVVYDRTASGPIANCRWPEAKATQRTFGEITADSLELYESRQDPQSVSTSRIVRARLRWAECEWEVLAESEPIRDVTLLIGGRRGLFAVGQDCCEKKRWKLDPMTLEATTYRVSRRQIAGLTDGRALFQTSGRLEVRSPPFERADTDFTIDLESHWLRFVAQPDDRTVLVAGLHPFEADRLVRVDLETGATTEVINDPAIRNQLDLRWHVRSSSIPARAIYAPTNDRRAVFRVALDTGETEIVLATEELGLFERLIEVWGPKPGPRYYSTGTRASHQIFTTR